MLVVVTAAAGSVLVAGMDVIMVMMLMAMVVMMLMAMVVMMLMAMVVMMMSAMTMIVPAGVRVGALGLEGAHHVRDAAALPSRQLGKGMVVLDIDGVALEFRRGVALPELPGEAQETQRVLGPDLEKTLRRSADLDEPAVFELDGITVVEDGRPVEV